MKKILNDPSSTTNSVQEMHRIEQQRLVTEEGIDAETIAALSKSYRQQKSSLHRIRSKHLPKETEK